MFLVDKATDEVWSIVAEGIPPIRFAKTIGLVGATVTGPASSTFPTAMQMIASTDQWTRKQDTRRTTFCVCRFCTIRQRCIGALQILNKTDGEAGKGETVTFDDDDIKIMMSFCKVVANSIVLLLSEKESEAGSVASKSGDTPRNDEPSKEDAPVEIPKGKVKGNQVAPDPGGQ